MDQLVASLLIWISLHTGYAVDEAAPPAVTVLSAAQYRARLDAHHAAERWSVKARAHDNGLFDWSTAARPTIYLLDPREHAGASAYRDPLDNPVFRAHLVHQLVHHAQHHLQVQRQWHCNVQGEFPAEAIAWNYLFSQGIKAPMPKLQDWVKLADSC